MRDRKWGDEDGTILLMVPAGLLVMILLGAMAFDLSLSFAGERRIADLAATWADEALARVDLAAFYRDEQRVRLDEDLARQAVRDAWASTVDPGIVWTSPPVVIFLDEVTVEVTVTGEVPLLFLDAVPGVHHRTITTTTVASLVTSS